MIQFTKWHIRILTGIFILVIASFSVCATTFDSYSYLRNISSDEFDYSSFSKEEVDYIEHLIFDSISKVFPLALQEKLLEEKFVSLDQIQKDLHYCQIWDVEIRKLDLFSQYNINAFFAVRTDMTSIWLIAPILFDKVNKVYYILGIEELSCNRFNDIINVSITSEWDAIEYVKDYIFLKFYQKPIDEEWFDVTTYKYKRIKDYVHLLYPPKPLFSNDEIYIVELFIQTGILYLDRGINKTIAIVTKQGKITLIEMQIIE